MTEQSPYYGDDVAAANQRASEVLTTTRCAPNPVQAAEAEIVRLTRENARLQLAVQAWRGFTEGCGYVNADQFDDVEKSERCQMMGVAMANREERERNERRNDRRGSSTSRVGMAGRVEQVGASA